MRPCITSRAVDDVSPCMRADVEKYEPFNDHFKYHIMATGIKTKKMANLVEQNCITTKDATNPECGCNTYDGQSATLLRTLGTGRCTRQRESSSVLNHCINGLGRRDKHRLSPVKFALIMMAYLALSCLSCTHLLSDYRVVHAPHIVIYMISILARAPHFVIYELPIATNYRAPCISMHAVHLLLFLLSQHLDPVLKILPTSHLFWIVSRKSKRGLMKYVGLVILIRPDLTLPRASLSTQPRQRAATQAGVVISTVASFVDIKRPLPLMPTLPLTDDHWDERGWYILHQRTEHKLDSRP